MQGWTLNKAKKNCDQGEEHSDQASLKKPENLKNRVVKSYSSCSWLFMFPLCFADLNCFNFHDSQSPNLKNLLCESDINSIMEAWFASREAMTASRFGGTFCPQLFSGVTHGLFSRIPEIHVMCILEIFFQVYLLFCNQPSLKSYFSLICLFYLYLRNVHIHCCCCCGPAWLVHCWCGVTVLGAFNLVRYCYILNDAE